LDALAADVRRQLSGTGLEVQLNRALRQEALQVFDRTFAITDALRLLAVIVAFIGIVGALMAHQLERTRELATLQALGMTGGQLRTMTLMETGLIGAAAGVLSWPIGLTLAAVLVYVINLRSFGWSIRLQIEPAILLQAVLIGLVASLLAAVYPLRRLEQMEVAAGLRQE
jgi:putative ABC transport system permease protein